MPHPLLRIEWRKWDALIFRRNGMTRTRDDLLKKECERETEPLYSLELEKQSWPVRPRREKSNG